MVHVTWCWTYNVLIPSQHRHDYLPNRSPSSDVRAGILSQRKPAIQDLPATGQLCRLCRKISGHKDIGIPIIRLWSWYQSSHSCQDNMHFLSFVEDSRTVAWALQRRLVNFAWYEGLVFGLARSGNSFSRCRMPHRSQYVVGKQEARRRSSRIIGSLCVVDFRLH